MIPSYLIVIFVLTIVLTRTFLSFYPIHSPKIGRFQMHHYMHGLILIAVYFITSEPILIAVGSALIVDEIPLFFIFKTLDLPEGRWKQYFSWQCVLGILIISIIGYFALNFFLI